MCSLLAVTREDVKLIGMVTIDLNYKDGSGGGGGTWKIIFMLLINDENCKNVLLPIKHIACLLNHTGG